MKSRVCLVVLAAVVLLLGIPASAQILYENGPINGETDAWTINFGFVVNDSFTISTGSSTISGLSFGAWLTQGDVLQSVDVLMSSEAFGGTIYFNSQVNVTQSGCFVNNYGFDVCTETANFSGPTLADGTYWLSLLNATVNDGDPVYWDENSGSGCHSEGCPSQACEGDCVGSIPAEAFSILGSSGGTGSVPEPGSLALFAGGFAVVAGGVRRKFWS